jgi:hypothetical protein
MFVTKYYRTANGHARHGHNGHAIIGNGHH